MYQTTVTAPALTSESKSKVVALQKELGVTADGIVGPQTIAAAKAKIANSRSYSEVVGLIREIRFNILMLINIKQQQK